MANKNLSIIRQNYHEETEAGINRQINMELYASYVYQSMASYFDRDDIALPGFSKFFAKNSEDEHKHAVKLMKYQNNRGGRVVFKDVKKPEKDEWGTGLDPLQAALDLEKRVNQSLLDLHALGGSHNDAHLCDFLENEFLSEQVESIKHLGELISKLKRAGPGLGEYIFDKDLKE
jgi:ferritin heavy chain